MLEKWKKVTDKGECVSAIFMDFSRAFDTLNHDIMITKLKIYNFSREVLKFMQSYLKNRKQRVKINKKFISERDVTQGFHRFL